MKNTPMYTSLYLHDHNETSLNVLRKVRRTESLTLSLPTLGLLSTINETILAELHVFAVRPCQIQALASPKH